MKLREQRDKVNELLRRDQEYTWLGLIAMGITVNEIAAAYNVSVPTVYAATQIGRKHIAEPISPSLVRELGDQLRRLPIQVRSDNLGGYVRYKVACQCLRDVERGVADYERTMPRTERIVDLIEHDHIGRLKVKDGVEITDFFRHFNPALTDEAYDKREATAIAEIKRDEERFLTLITPEEREIYLQAKAKTNSRALAAQALEAHSHADHAMEA